MTKDELVEALEKFLNDHDDVESAGRVTGEPTIGVEMRDGTEYFVEVQNA